MKSHLEDPFRKHSILNYFSFCHKFLTKQLSEEALISSNDIFQNEFETRAPSIYLDTYIATLAPPLQSTNSGRNSLCVRTSLICISKQHLQTFVAKGCSASIPLKSSILSNAEISISTRYLKFHIVKFPHSSWTNWCIKGYALTGCELIVKNIIEVRLYGVMLC